jgi:GntR family transcriptional regulator
MIFDIDTTSSNPIYAQLITQVKHAIAAGVLRPGDGLPSLRENSKRLRVNPLTVAKAYRQLEAEGIVITEHGRGTFVNSRSEDFGSEYRREALEQAVDRMLVEAYHLGASPNEVRSVVEDRVQVQGSRVNVQGSGSESKIQGAGLEREGDRRGEQRFRSQDM